LLHLRPALLAVCLLPFTQIFGAELVIFNVIQATDERGSGFERRIPVRELGPGAIVAGDRIELKTGIRQQMELTVAHVHPT